jgi:hypothetical protein
MNRPTLSNFRDLSKVDNKQLRNIYETACCEYIKRLCKMYDWDYPRGWWVSDQPGGVFCTDDIEYSLGMDDIKLLVDAEVPFSVFEQWWDYNSSEYIKDSGSPNIINLHSWLNGMRPRQ